MAEVDFSKVRETSFFGQVPTDKDPHMCGTNFIPCTPIMNFETPHLNGSNLDQKITNLLNIDIKNGNHKGAFAIYGNVKDQSQGFVGVGESAKGKPWTSANIIRFASQSKLIGSIVLMKVLEEGLVSLSDPVSKYMPEFSRQLSYYDSSNNVVTGLDGNTILVSNLASMSTGLGYQWVDWGATYGGLFFFYGPTAPAPFSSANTLRFAAMNAKLRANGLFWDWDFDPTIYQASQASGFLLPSFKRFVDAVISPDVPLLFKPGSNSTRDSVYGLDYDILGGVVNVAVKNAGYASFWDYFTKKFLTPMSITSFSQIGNPVKPQNLSSLIVKTAFRRPPGNLQPDGTQFAPDADPAYLATQAGNLVWAADYNDGFRYNEVLPTTVVAEPDDYQGYFGSGFSGTPGDYCKFFELIVGNGIYRNIRLVDAQFMSMLTNPTLPEFSSFGIARFNVFASPNFNNFNSPIANPLAQGLFVVGYNEHWGFGNANGNTSLVDSLYQTNSMSKTVLRWGGYYGTNYYLDYSTGNYVIAGIQEDANSLKTGTSGYNGWAGTIFGWLTSPSSCS